MAKYKGKTEKIKVAKAVRPNRTSKLLKLQIFNSLLLLSILAWLTKEYWLPIILSIKW